MRKMHIRMIGCVLAAVMAFASLPLSSVPAFASEIILSEDDALLTDDSDSVLVSDDSVSDNELDVKEKTEINLADTKTLPDEIRAGNEGSVADDIRYEVFEADNIIQEGGFPKNNVFGNNSRNLLKASNSTYVHNAALDKAAEAITNWNGVDSTITVDLSAYGIPKADIRSFSGSVVNSHPEFFSLPIRIVILFPQMKHWLL